MLLDSRIFLDVVVNTSFVLTAAATIFLAALFADTLFLRFDLKTFLKSLGFGMFGIFWILNINLGLIAGLLFIFIGFVLDPFSKLRPLTPLPIVFLLFLSDHLLLFVLGLLITISIFQLAYTTSHRDLMPLGVGFVLLSIGEYFYHLKGIEHLSELSLAGSFLYLFASLIFLGWLWSYIGVRFFRITFKTEGGLPSKLPPRG